MAADKNLKPLPRPFKLFEYGLQNQKRKPGHGGRPKTVVEIEQHGRYLVDKVDEFQRIIDSQESSRKIGLPTLPDKVQVILKTDGLSPADVSRLGMEFVEERDEGVLVTISRDKYLSELIKKAKSYLQEKTEKPKYRNLIDPLVDFWPSSIEDKIGERLYEKIDQLNDDDSISVEIELAGGNTDSGAENRIDFSNYIRSLNNDIPEDSEIYRAGIIGIGEIVEAEYSVHRVFMPIYAIKDLLNSSRASWIISIDLIPEIEEDLIRLGEMTAGSIPPLVQPQDDSPRLVVIDSGIASGHPVFRDPQGNSILGRAMNFLPNAQLEDAYDDILHGHGTGVASIAAYKSIKEYLLTNDPQYQPFFWIENAKILLAESSIYPNGNSEKAILHPIQMPKDLMKKIVQHFHLSKPETCKIFNLSIGSAPHRINNWISNWAEEIDNLTAMNDVLFVISAGNLLPDEVQTFINRDSHYPSYLLDRRSRLLNPAQAYSGISVGSITDNSSVSFENRALGNRAIADPEHPSPFSRTGLLLGNVVKPDVVDLGGNLALTDQNLVRRLAELSVPVAHRDFTNEGLLTFQCGTSLATPRVSNLAIKIQSQNPAASANLIRALLINSAEWPILCEDPFRYPVDPLGATKEEIIASTLKLCGYGIPREEKALSSNTSCIIFTTEDFLTWVDNDKTDSKIYPGKVSFYTIRLDKDDIKRNLPPGMPVRVKVTLAYNPQVRKNYRKSYLGVEVRWDVRKQDQPFEDFQAQWIEDLETKDEIEVGEGVEIAPRNIYHQYNWVLKPILNPGNSKRKGTTISDWFDIDAFGLPDTIDIAISGRVAPWLKPPISISQRFALVVSIEALQRDVPIYDMVRVRNQVQVRAR